MIALKDNRISIYQGDYRPVEAMRNGQKLAGWKRVGMTGSEGEFTGTYNDALTVYGKSGYRESRNLCQPPEAKTMNDGIIEVVLEPTANGRFDLSSRTVSNDVAMMMSPNIVHSVTLSAGTYTASSNSVALGLSMGDEMVYSLPHTFTLETDQTVYFGTYSTDFAETDLYLQIESGESVTDYDTYAGDPTKEPSPDNIRPLDSAQGEITSSGKNIYPFFEDYGRTSSPGTARLLEVLPNGFIFQGGYEESSHSISSWDNGWGVFGGDGEWLYLRAEETVTISADYTVLEAHESRTGHESIGIWFYGNNTQYASVTHSIPSEIGKPTRVRATYTVHVDGYYWPIFTLNSNKVKIENLQIEYGRLATPYQPYLPPHTAAVPALRGIEVTSTAPYNYAETVDGMTHYYISDVLQGERLMRNIGVLVLNGTENWSTYELASDKGFCLYNAVATLQSNAVACLCNTFSGLTREEMYRGGLGISIGAAQELRVSQCYEWFGGSIAQFKAYLAERYTAGNPVIVYYVLAEPKIEVVDTYPKAMPCYTKVIAKCKEGLPEFGLSSCLKVQES